MCTSSTVQSRPGPAATAPALLRFWRMVGYRRSKPLAQPAGLDHLTPHMRRDIGLENRAAVHWPEATPHIDPDTRRP